MFAIRRQKWWSIVPAHPVLNFAHPLSKFCLTPWRDIMHVWNCQFIHIFYFYFQFTMNTYFGKSMLQDIPLFYNLTFVKYQDDPSPLCFLAFVSLVVSCWAIVTCKCLSHRCIILRAHPNCCRTFMGLSNKITLVYIFLVLHRF